MQEAGGFIGQLPVGSGKTLISFLAPMVLDSKHWVLLVPVSLREKTQQEYNTYVANGWVLPPLKLATYNDVSRHDRVDKVLNRNLDLIICDEAHHLRNTTAGRTSRIQKFFQDNPNCRLVCLHGTLTDRSICDYAHQADWALRDGSPVPRDWYSLQSWSTALDSRVPGGMRTSPGVLLKLPGAEDDGRTQLERARAAYFRRLAETPGVLVLNTGGPQVSLLCTDWHPKISPKLRTALRACRDGWVRPDGEHIMLATEWWRVMRTLSIGCYHYWDEPAPDWWLAARTNWAEFVRRKGRARDIDTEGDVARSYPNAEPWLNWQQSRQAWRPTPKVAWVCDGIIKQLRPKLTQHTIIWVKHPDVGHKVAEVLSIPYIGAGENPHAVKGPVCLSGPSHGTGQNLQYWRHNIILEVPSSAATIEQWIGRTHRRGQEEDVSVVFPLHTDELYTSLMKTVDDLDYIMQASGQKPRMVLADWQLKQR